jgi:hypothetical protein
MGIEKHHIVMFVNMRPNLPFGTIISTCSLCLGTMASGFARLQNISSPKRITKLNGDLESLGLSKASKNPIIHKPSIPMTPLQSILGEILKVTSDLFDVVGDNESLQFQIFAKFKHICAKMEVLKFQLEVGVCHPLGKSLTTIVNASPFSLKWNFDFVDGMKMKGCNLTLPSQP